MGCKAILFLCISFAVILMIASDAAARDLAEASTSVETSKEGGYPGGGDGGYPGGGNGGYPGGGNGGYPGGGHGGYPGGGNGGYPGGGNGGYPGGGNGGYPGGHGGGYCRYRCCRRGYCRCCSYAEAVAVAAEP